jgi:hypothetical protein
MFDVKSRREKRRDCNLTRLVSCYATHTTSEMAERAGTAVVQQIVLRSLSRAANSICRHSMHKPSLMQVR